MIKMQTYNNIRQIFPTFRLSTILKSIESTITNGIPEPAEDIYRKINGSIFILSNQDGRCTLSTVIDIQSPFLVKSYDNIVEAYCVNQRIKYIVYELHVDVFNALRSIYLRENNTNFPFFNSYTSEYWHTVDELGPEEYNEEVHSRILNLKPDFNIDDIYKKFLYVYEYSKVPITFELPKAINKVQFNGKEILFETEEGNKMFPCNIATYDIVISQLLLQSTRTIPFLDRISQYHSTYRIHE